MTESQLGEAMAKLAWSEGHRKAFPQMPNKTIKKKYGAEYAAIKIALQSCDMSRAELTARLNLKTTFIQERLKALRVAGEIESVNGKWRLIDPA